MRPKRLASELLLLSHHVACLVYQPKGSVLRSRPVIGSLSSCVASTSAVLVHSESEAVADAVQDLRHLKSVPELANASPEASRPDAPLSSSPITLSPLHGPRWNEAPEASTAADRTPVPTRQGSSRCEREAACEMLPVQGQE